MMLTKLGLSLVVLLVLSSCLPNSKQNTSRVKIDSGRYITSKSSNKVNAVGYIQMSDGAACSATAVSDNTLLTAAHCIGGLANSGSGQKSGRVCFTNALYKNICSTQIFFPPEYGPVAIGNMIYDVAIAMFPNGTFKEYFSMANTFAQTGEGVLLVGYSERNPGPGAEGSKRWGSNSLEGRSPSDGAIVTTYRQSPDGVAVSPGDSGGPMFNAGCKVIGVASRMTESYPKKSLHTDMTSGISMAWLKSMESKAGAYFCGLTGEDPNRCNEAGMARLSNNLPRDEFPCAPGSGSGGGNDNNQALYLALSGNGQNPVILLSAPSNLQVESADLCEGSANDCKQGRGAVKATLAPASGFQLQGRSVLRTNSGVEFSPNGGKFILIARDRNKNPVSYQSLILTKR